MALGCFFGRAESQDLKLRFRLSEKTSTGTPIAGADVSVTTESTFLKNTETAKDGTFNLLLPLNRQYNITIHKRGFKDRVVLVSTFLPADQANLHHEFSLVKLPLEPTVSAAETQEASMSEIFFDTKVGAFHYNYQSQRRTKKVTIMNLEAGISVAPSNTTKTTATESGRVTTTTVRYILTDNDSIGVANKVLPTDSIMPEKK